MLTTHAVGIDLGTTYSCIAYLNEHGEPVTLANQEGELSTPSVVLFDDHETVVGTEALRNAIVHPDRVVQNSKRFIGDRDKRWEINGRRFSPVEIAALILKKLIAAAQEQIGNIEEAVITVPAQFSDAQRHATIEAGHRAGLQRVDIINEPVAAALCHVLGNEGLWFTELAEEQRIMVYDLGGGTFDLSLVSYKKNEVSVIASSGDLELGGIDWTNGLVDAIAARFRKEFGSDPRSDPQSLQFLTLEAEQAKRSLTVRPRAALTCQHGGERKTYQVEQSQFERISRGLVQRTADITKRMLKDNRMGWAHVDVVLTTGGSSRMPMIRNTLKQLSGTTLNTALSPDQSIAHGATYYAGMLLTNKKFARSILSEKASQRLSQIRQQSVTARALGVMVRDMQTQQRVPHYLIPPNSPLPIEQSQRYGTVVPNQKRVRLQIVESGADRDKPHVKLGECVIDGLPDELPEGSQIEVLIRYDEQARVHVAARDVASGRRASAEILRHENLVPQLKAPAQETDVSLSPGGRQPAGSSKTDSPAPPQPQPVPRSTTVPPPAPRPAAQAQRPKPAVKPQPAPSTRATPQPRPQPKPRTAPPIVRKPQDDSHLEEAHQPIPLCNSCGEPLDSRGRCPACGDAAANRKAAQPSGQRKVARRRPASQASRNEPPPRGEHSRAKRAATAKNNRGSRPVPPPIDDAEILDLNEDELSPPKPRRKPSQKTGARKPPKAKGRRPKPEDSGEDEFWKLVD